MQHRELIGFFNSHVISAKVWIPGFYALVLFSLVRKELIKKNNGVSNPGEYPLNMILPQISTRALLEARGTVRAAVRLQCAVTLSKVFKAWGWPESSFWFFSILWQYPYGRK